MQVSVDLISARIANLASTIAQEAIAGYRQRSFTPKKKRGTRGATKKEEIPNQSEGISFLHDRIQVIWRVADALELPGIYSEQVRQDLRKLTEILANDKWSKAEIKRAYAKAAKKVDRISRRSNKIRSSELHSHSDNDKTDSSSKKTKPLPNPSATAHVKFNILFLSDLHWSIKDRDRWNILEGNFFSSLKQAIKDAGPIDLIIFGGDLVNTGAPEEYEGKHSVETFLNRLKKAASLEGVEVPFLVVPGNHDVRRPFGPKPGDSELKQFLLEQQKHAFESNSPQCGFIQDAFSNFSKWSNNFINEQTEKVLAHSQYTKGVLPGDFSCSISKGNFRVGIVGLNSTYLQLHEGKFKKLLHVDRKQLLQITGENCDHWMTSNDLNILVTHHPSSWFNSDSEKSFNEEIFNPKWFGVHLHGHMHEAVWNLRAASPASAHQYIFQSPSLLSSKSVEHEDGRMTERISGYCILQFCEESDSVSLRMRPRNLDSGGHEIFPQIPDFSPDGWTKTVKLIKILRDKH